MKVIILGDIHGRTLWKKVIEKENYDKIIFIGDYMDSFDVPGVDQLSNFKEIIKFKKDNMEKVVLLFGNHDYHYLPGIKEHYSGYQPYLSFDIGQLIEDNKHLFCACYIHNNFLISHAGITDTWYKEVNKSFEEKYWEVYEDLDKKINIWFKFYPQFFGFATNSLDPYGNDVRQSPFWVRPQALSKNKNKFKDYIQIVGHTQQRGVNQKYKGIILIDTLCEPQPEYLIIENDIIKIGKI